MIIIVNGLLDNDYYCSSLYRHIFQMNTELYPDISKLIEEFQKLDFENFDYDYDTRDELNGDEKNKINNDIYIEKLLKKGIGIAPNIQKNQLLKYANVLEFVSLKECMKFLNLIKYWGQKEKKVYIYIYHYNIYY